jgi:elongation factor Ts
MAIAIEDIRALRERTGAGVGDCKEALAASAGDIEKAIDWLRQKGLAQAAKRAGRVANEGVVDAYIHSNAKVGVLVELNCETDFVANTDDFKKLAHELSLHIAGRAPRWVAREDVPAEELEREQEVARAKAREENKPENVLERIVSGSVDKFVAENCLLEQGWVRDDKIKIKDLIAQTGAKLQENVTVRRFARFRIGED